MKKHSLLWIVTVSIYGAALLSFFLFFLYIILFENVHTETSRMPAAKREICEYFSETIADESAPAGVKTVYRFQIEEDVEECSIFYFYTVHHHAHVYYGDELVYALEAGENNKIGKSISSNWVIVPIHSQDIGKEITVVLMPLFKSVIHQKVDFQIGSYFTGIYSQLKSDLPLLFLSAMCICLGIFIIAIHLYFFLRMKNFSRDTFFLGVAAIILGLWRITDAKSSSLIFVENPMVLGYITIGSLFLCCTPLILFINASFSNKKHTSLLWLAIITSLVSVLVLVLQLSGVAEFKQMLELSHITMIVSIIIVIIMSIVSRRERKTYAAEKNWKYFFILFAGVFLDIFSFYITKSSSGIMFTLIAFMIYVLIMFIKSLILTTQRAYTDVRTGLLNKAHWNDLISILAPRAENTGFVMIDMNALKRVNDQYGHEAGDRIIYHFSNILRNTFPSSCLISHWGGDEFSIMTLNIKKEELEFYLSLLKEQVEKHNDAISDPPIHYAVGYALSEEEGETRNELLLDIADQRMYENKKNWYKSQAHPA